MENAPFDFGDDGERLLNWASSRISPARRRMAAAVGFDRNDLRQEAALWLLRSPPADGIARSTAVMNATSWAAANVGIHFDRHCRNGQFRTRAVGEFHDLRDKSGDLHQATENRDVVSLALRSLPGRWRTVLELRYGLGTDRFERNCMEVGELMGLTGERVRQIEKAAMTKLRKLRTFQAA